MTEMIAVKIYWNTHPDGTPVNMETVDWDAQEAPISIYGPFDTITDAVSWIDNDYPEEDTDVEDITADLYDIPEGWVINDPRAFQDGSPVDLEHPDEDVRSEDSQEIHVP